jgi:hypothetical protein
MAAVYKGQAYDTSLANLRALGLALLRCFQNHMRSRCLVAVLPLGGTVLSLMGCSE